MSYREGCQVSLHLYTYSSPFRSLEDEAFVTGNGEPTGYTIAASYIISNVIFLNFTSSLCHTGRDDRYAHAHVYTRLPFRLIIQAPIAHHTSSCLCVELCDMNLRPNVGATLRRSQQPRYRS